MQAVQRCRRLLNACIRISNAIFTDPFNYQWMLHQVHKAVSHEEHINQEEKENK